MFPFGSNLSWPEPIVWGTETSRLCRIFLMVCRGPYIKQGQHPASRRFEDDNDNPSGHARRFMKDLPKNPQKLCHVGFA